MFHLRYIDGGSSEWSSGVPQGRVSNRGTSIGDKITVTDKHGHKIKMYLS